MYHTNDTLNSTQNSTINITQLMATTTTHRRSRFVNPGQANPAPEDEDIYVSLQVLQAQMNTRSQPAGSQDLLERVLSKVDKLQTTVDNLSQNYKSYRRRRDSATSIENVQPISQPIEKKPVQCRAVSAPIAKKKLEAVVEKSKPVEVVSEKEEKPVQVEIKPIKPVLEPQIYASQSEVQELRQQLKDLKIKVETLEAKQNDKVMIERQHIDKPWQPIEGPRTATSPKRNNSLLQQNWALQKENKELRSELAKMILKSKQQAKHDTIMPLGKGDVMGNLRAMLEREYITKTGYAAPDAPMF